MNKKVINIALAGNPNSGKTTIFNALTGSRQKVGNYPGVTVEKKEGHLDYGDYSLHITDLPGTYSLTAYTLDELVARNFILHQNPDLIINIIDASNLSRNLYLTTQLLELEVPVLLCFNMSDIAEKNGLRLDETQFSRLMRSHIVHTIGNKEKGIKDLCDGIINSYENISNYNPIKIAYSKEIEKEIFDIKELIAKSGNTNIKIPFRYLAIKLLEKDKDLTALFSNFPIKNELSLQIDESRKNLESIFGEDVESRIIDEKHGFIHGIIGETVKQFEHHFVRDISDKIDIIVTNRLLSIPIFLFIMWLMFKMTFVLAEFPVMWLETFFGWLSVSIESIMIEGLLRSLLIQGVIGGVGGVLSFIPNILILFFLISILEDSGYMARAAFIMDRLMHKIGLHGKSFIPLIIGFGCTVPAYMASRILKNKRDRLITMHINTFMSCGARLPVYVLFCGAFWPESQAGNVLFSIYLLGILFAIIIAKLLSRFRFKGGVDPFVMELPPYHLPTLKGVILHMWEKGSSYVRKAGTIILAVSVVMWVLTTFPHDQKLQVEFKEKAQQISSSLNEDQRSEKLSQLNNQLAQQQLLHSYGGRIGQVIEPVIRPLGFDWKIGIGLFAASAAKELVVATLGTIYGVGESEASELMLREKLKNDPAYTPLTAYSLMVFVLLYFPCIAALVVFYKESGSIKETLLQIFYTASTAYLVSLVIYQTGSLLGIGL